MLDSSVGVSAFRSRLGASSLPLGLVGDGRPVPLTTPALLIECEDVLKRPGQREAPGLSPAEVDTALTARAALVQPVEVRFMRRPQLADPGDEMVLDAAVNGQADALAAPRFGLTLLRPGAHSDDCSHRFRLKPATDSDRSQPGVPMIPAG